MGNVSIGSILKQRIKEMNFTQRQFCEITDVSETALKTYMNGTRSYTYDVLERFSKALNCSYDYLLGVSKVPERENQDIRNLTRLSDASIKELIGLGKCYDTSDICKAYLNTLDTIIESGYLFQMIGTYFMSPEDTFNTNQDMIKSICSTVLKDGMDENYPFDSVFMPDGDTLFTLTLRNILKHTKELYLSKQQ